VSLKITGFVCSPEEISQILEMQPTRIWRKGELIHDRLQVRHGENGWMRSSGLTPDKSTEEQVRALIHALVPAKERFATLPDEAAVSILCVVYSEYGRPDISLPAGLVRKIADIGAGVEFDLYCMIDYPPPSGG
jgi:hypothetical protein